MSYINITPSDLKQIAQDGQVTASELLSLVSNRLNGNGSPGNGVEGWTTPFVDLMQYSFTEAVPITVTVPADNAMSVTLTAGTLKNSDGYSLSLTTASASYAETLSATGGKYSGSSALKFSLMAPGGVTFSIDFSGSDSGTWTQVKGGPDTYSGSGKDSLVLSFKDTKGTTGATDDITISSTYTSTDTYSNSANSYADTRSYNYLGNGFTITQKDQTIVSTRNYKDINGDRIPEFISGTWNQTKGSYNYKNISNGIEISFDGTGSGNENPINTFTGTGEYTAVNIASSLGKISTTKVSDNLDGTEPKQFVGTSGPGALEGLLHQYLSGVTLTGSNTITINAIGDTGQSIDAGTGNDTITGSSGADVIDDGAGDDSVSAGGGTDVLNAGLGNDTLNGGDGDDMFVAGGVYDGIRWLDGGKDVIDGGSGNDRVVMRMVEGSYVLSKSGTDLILTNSPGNIVTVKNTVEGIQFSGTGDVTSSELMSGAGSKDADVLFRGESGSFDAKTKLFTPNGTPRIAANIDALAGNDTVFGTEIFSDILQGGEGNDRLTGYGGNDLLDGGLGNDTLDGGTDSDFYIVDSASDQITGEILGDPSSYLGDSFGNNILQIKGDTSYDLKDQAIGFIVAGNINKTIFDTGADQSFWLDLSTTNKANIKGNTYGQRIVGNAAANKLEGMGGNDSIFGGAGNDTLEGGAGNDTLDGSLGEDLLLGGAGDDYVQATIFDAGVNQWILAGQDTVDGGDGNDYVNLTLTSADLAFSKSGSDLLIMRAGSGLGGITVRNNVENVIINGAAYQFSGLFNSASSKDADLLFKGGTYNSYSREFSPDGVSTIYDGAGGDDTIYGSNAGDTLAGGEGNDRIHSFGGNDKLVGGVGRDTLIGGEGDDQYYVSDIDDIIVDQLGRNHVIASVSYTLPSETAIYDLSAAGKAFGDASSDTLAINLTGNVYDNTILGNGAGNILDGGRGSDVLFGADGNDTLLGNQGDDFLYGYAGNDSLLGGDGHDTFYIDTEPLLANINNQTVYISSHGGIDTLVGGSGIDTLFLSQSIANYSFVRSSDSAVRVLNAQGDTIAQVSEIETILAGAPGSQNTSSLASLLNPSEFADVLTIKAGLPVNGGKGNDTIYGSTGDDFIEGGDGDDFLMREATAGITGGNDILLGGAGNDILQFVSGYGGNLVLDGGSGNDIYVIDTPNGYGQSPFVISDASGSDTLRFNFYRNMGFSQHADSPYFAFVDGPLQQLNIVYRDGAALSIIDVSVLESWEHVLYQSPFDTEIIESQRMNLVYAVRDTKTGSWNAKGTDKDDLIWATKGAANVYDGGKGDDIVAIWPYADSVIQGGEGLNRLYGNGTSGTLSYAWSTGKADINLLAGVGMVFDGKGEELLALDEISGLLNVVGGKGDDFILGDARTNMLNGSDGNDTISGFGGYDVLVGGVGNDVYRIDLVRDVGTVASERQGASVSTSNTGGVVSMSLQGGTDTKGTDTLVLTNLRSFGDLQFSVSTSTVLVGTEQRAGWQTNFVALADRNIEQISFGIGNNSPTTVYTTNWGSMGTKGNDLVLGRVSGGVLHGGLGNDLLVGTEGANVLVGGIGNDLLVGQGGADRLFGGVGNDTIWVNVNDADIAVGGLGSDTFVFDRYQGGTGVGPSQIIDFNINEDFLRFESVSAVTLNPDGYPNKYIGVGSPQISVTLSFDGSGLLMGSALGSVRLVGLSEPASFDFDLFASRILLGEVL